MCVFKRKQVFVGVGGQIVKSKEEKNSRSKVAENFMYKNNNMIIGLAGAE